MVIVDTTVWIDFFAGKHTKNTDYLRKIIENSEDICICGLIMTEVLQGLRSEKEYVYICSIYLQENQEKWGNNSKSCSLYYSGYFQ
jgi:predicted nucleic acid-binding protein